MNVDELVASLRKYRGVARKASISSVADVLLPPAGGTLLAAAGEDAAALRWGDEVLLLAADGILEDLATKDPEWAGYCSVLVNVNDIAGMGGLPVAMVNVLSCRGGNTRAAIVGGMKRACDKFGVPMVGGHLHPDTSYTAVDVAILGRTDMAHLLLSSSAKPGDSVIFAIDLDGAFTPGIPFSFDTTSEKSSREVISRLVAVHRAADRLTAGKDISNPGALGTLGMLLEASRKGAVIDVSAIPRPEAIDIGQWLQAYQGCGFVLTCGESRSDEVMTELSDAGLTSSICGSVNESNLLELEWNGRRRTLFDLSRDVLGCRVPQKL